VVIVIVLLSHLERFFLFFPTSEVAHTPLQVGLEYDEVYFATEDGQQLNGWFIPGPSDVTWLWFHGNGGNISHRVEEIALINRRLGVNLFIFDYRGYGQSEGKPSERGTYRDARAALQYLQGRSDVNQDKIIYFGRSLGAAVAVELAVDHPPLGLILVAPFASLSDMARVHYSALPGVSWLARNRYNSLDRIIRINRPLLIIHGSQDSTVPLSQGQKLYQAANQPKRFLALPLAGHDNTYLAGGAVYWETLSEFLAILAK
jgi:fermentation-respiration switch protein FrsA (DUF1100 family)